MSLDLSSPEGRIFYIALALAILAALILAPWRGPLSALALAIGATFAILNYVWLVAGANALVAAAAGQQLTRPMARGVVLFFLRFALLAACVSAILISRLVPLLPVLGGLFVVPAAATVEGVRQLTLPRISAKKLKL